MIENNTEVETCIWTYWVRPECEDEFRSLFAQNWPTMRRLGFVTEDPPTLLRSSEDPPVYVEIFNWTPGSLEPAHRHPEVLKVWEAMGPLVEDREDVKLIPGMTFPFYRPVSFD